MVVLSLNKQLFMDLIFFIVLIIAIIAYAFSSFESFVEEEKD